MNGLANCLPHLVMVLAFVAMTSQSGCALLPDYLKQKASSLESATIQVEPWLGQTTSIPLSLAPTFMSVVGSKELLEHHVALKAMGTKLSEPQLDDNSVALVRGNEVWYFVRPWELAAIYALAFPLKATDRILTLPIERSIFCGAEPSKPFQYLRIDPDGTSNLVTVSTPQERQIGTLRKNSPPYSTCFVLTRISGSITHRLVLPIQFEGIVREEIGEQLDPILMRRLNNNGLDLRPGDIVEFSNPTLISKRLGGTF